MLDTVLLYGLLLTGVAVGWAMGYRYSQQSGSKSHPDFIPSIEYILASSSDASLSRLLDVDNIDEDALDLLLKLGKALRNKGETERAIHLHQTLFARKDIPRKILSTLKFELALDYLEAGLLDRAERLFIELMDLKGDDFEEISKHLIELYEEESEWQKIVDLHAQYKLQRFPKLSKRVSHAICELAERAVNQRHYLEAHQFCRRALKIDSNCARAYVVQGNLAYTQNEPNEAIRCYIRALDINPKAIFSVLDKLYDSYLQVQDEKGLMHTLNKQWQISRYVPVLKLYSQRLSKQQSPHYAVNHLLEELAKQPSNLGFELFAELVVKHELQLDALQLKALYDILHEIVDHEPKFQCNKCGLRTEHFHWRCPNCKSWSSISAFVAQTNRSKLNL